MATKKVDDNKFYVYIYTRTIESVRGRIGSPYYVGKGSGNRSHVRKPSDIKPSKDKSNIMILESGMAESDAFELELFCVDFFGRVDLGTGSLHNRTRGGDGVCGIKMPPRKESHTQNFRNSMKKSGRMKEILCIDTGEIFESSLAAAMFVNSDSPTSCSSNILSVCKGTQVSAYGMLWKFVNGNDPRDVDYNRRKVLCVDLNKTFDSIRSVEKFLISNGKCGQGSKISDCCSGKRKRHAGYQWAYLTDVVHKVRNVQCVNTGEIFETAFDAVKKLRDMGVKASSSHITRCCNGDRPTAFGFGWKFVE